MALLVPVREGVLRLEPGEQQSLNSVLRVLRSEAAPISAWTGVAQQLLAAGREADFEALLTEAVERSPDGGSDRFGHVLALCSLAEFTAQQAAATRDRRRRAELLSRSTELCNRARRVSGQVQEQVTDLVFGNVMLIRVSKQAAGGGRPGVLLAWGGARGPLYTVCCSRHSACPPARLAACPT